MGENATKGLHYGSLGNIKYSAKEQSWTAQRLPIRSLSLLPVERLYFRCGPGDVRAKRSKVSGKHTEWALKPSILIDIYPELEPATPLLHEFSRSRYHRSFHLGQYDHAVSRTNGLLSVGKAHGFGGHPMAPVSILAYPAGENTDQLRLDALCTGAQGWIRQASSTPFAAFTSLEINQALSSTWECPTGGILQLKFSSASEGHGTLLAVRSATAIDIFRPAPGGRWNHAQSSKSHSRSILPGHLLQLRQDELFEHPACDIDFNMLNPLRFVVVDIMGCFKVLEISKRKNPDASRQFRTLTTGTARTVVQEADEVNGFAAFPHIVFWINASMLVIAGKSTISVFGTAKVTEKAAVLKLSDDSKVEIVHAKKSPFAGNEIFVLTTVDVVIARIEQHAERTSLEVTQRWRHYFDAREAAFRIAFRTSKDTQAQGLVLFSSKTSMIVEYTVLVQGHDDVCSHISAMNPSSIRSAGPVDDTLDVTSSVGLTDMHILEASRTESDVALSASHPNAEDALPEIQQIYQTFTFDQALSLSSHICIGSAEGQQPFSVERSHWGPDNQLMQPVRMTRTGDIEDFAVDDEDPPSGLDEPAARLRTFLSLENRDTSGSDVDQEASATHTNIVNSNKEPTVHVTVAHESVYVAQAMPTENISNTELRDVVQTRNNELMEGKKPLVPDKTLMDSAFENLNTSDLEDLMLSLDAATLQSSAGLQPIGKLFSSSSMHLHDLDAIIPEDASVSAIYNALVKLYILPLPSEIQGRIRIRLERVARSLAASIWLSSHAFAERPEMQNDIMSGADPAQNSSQEFPHLSSALPYMAPTTQDSLALSQPVLHGPSPPTQGSIQEPDPASISLSKYTTFKKPSTRSDNVSKILAHWDLGTNPASYDWREMTAKLAGGQYVHGSALTAEAQAKRQRRQARALERAAKRAKVAETFGVSTRQPQGIGRNAMSSQTGPGLVESAPSSSQAQSSAKPVAASQIEPGRFGGRLGASRLVVGRRRKAGF